MEEVKCAWCNCEWTHQKEVNIYDRKYEDSDVGVHLRYRGIGQEWSMDSNCKGNPSPRRDGLTIRLDCEQCDKPSLLKIYQHKGHTLVEVERIV